MDAIVTARVPAEIKEQGGEILREIGATPTQLVNAAYAYLLAEHRLPRGEGAKGPAPGHRALTPAQRERIRSSLAVMRVSAADPDDHRTFEEQLNDARSERYAAHLG